MENLKQIEARDGLRMAGFHLFVNDRQPDGGIEYVGRIKDQMGDILWSALILVNLDGIIEYIERM